MSTLIRRIRNEQSGVTLTEVLAAMAIGLPVLLAGFMLMDRSVSLSHEIADRQESIQRGRQAMELITRQLRSQVCLGENAEPIAYGDATRVTFYGDLSNGSRNVERRTLTYMPASGSVPGRITEQVEPGSGVYPDLVFTTLPSTTRPLIANVEPTRVGATAQPVFRYYAFQPGSPTGDLDELPVPLSAVNASRTVMVSIAFVAMPERRKPDAKNAATIQDNVYVRIADPTRPLEGPRCL